MANKEVVLLLPGFVPDEGLKTMLSQATLEKVPAGFENALKKIFNGFGHGAFSDAAFGAYAAGWNINPLQETWCRIRFLECQIDHQTAYAAGIVQPPLTETEQNSLVETFTPFFKEVEQDLHISPSGEWFLRVNQHTDVVTNDVASMIGKNITALLPSGPDQTFWRRLFTECQMLLSTHPVNLARKERRQSEILCFWFEGLGKINGPLSSSIRQIYTDDSAIQGAAKWAGVAYSSLGEGYTDALVNQMPVAIVDRTPLSGWETHWFEPLYQALAKGKLERLIIDDTKGRQFTLHRRHLYYFWRRWKHIKWN